MNVLKPAIWAFCLSGLLLCSDCLWGQQTVGTLPIVSAPAQVEPEVDVNLLQSLLMAKRPDLVFRADDVLTVNVVGIEDYAVKQRVAEDGSIAFPLIGKTQVAGLTTEQLQASIASALAAADMVHRAQVTITSDLRPNEVVSVLGDVVRPGIFPANGSLTLADYLSQANGFVENAGSAQGGSSVASYTVTLVRPTLSAPVRIPLSPRAADAAWGRIPLFAGDQVRVSKVGVIYAVGAFRNQGSYQLKNVSHTTVIDLVALAGGVGFEADSGDTHIVRKSDGKDLVIALKLSRILKGLDPDVVLQADDILFVPTNQLKAAIKGGGPSIIVSLATAALYR